MMLSETGVIWPHASIVGLSNDAALMIVGLAPLVALLFAAVHWDLREHRIPNPLVLIGIATGLMLHMILPPGDGFLAKWPGGLGFSGSLQGLAIAGGAMAPFYFLGAMGAGDVKLMAAVGAILGPEAAVPAVIGTFLAGGLVSLAVAFSLGSLGQLGKNLVYMAQVSFLKLALPGKPGIEPPVHSAGTAPYAVAIALGTLGGLAWVASGGG